MTHQPLWVILCHLPEKGRKEIEQIIEEMKERDREENLQSQMLYTKTQQAIKLSRFCRRFLCVFTIYGYDGHLNGP